MSTPGPFGGNPFEGLPIFGDLAKLFLSEGPIHWEIAKQMAQWVTTEGQSEPNVEPIVRIRFDDLLRVAEMHVASATGLTTNPGGEVVRARVVSRGGWAAATLDAYRPLLERLATSLAQAQLGGGADEPNPETELLGNLGQVLGPVLMGFQSGSMVGHLAQRAFGQYDLPIPRPPSDELLFVPSTIDAFAADWSLPADDARLAACVWEIAHHAVLGVPHVRRRLDDLLTSYVSGFRPDPGALEERLGSIDPSRPDSFQAALGDPEAVLGAMQTAEQQETMRQIDTLATVVEGYVDHVMDVVGSRVVGSHGPLMEALRRRRVERGPADRFVERMLGLELGQAQYDRGAAFVRGVVERAGEDALAPLWSSPRMLPTTAEVDAPGLWLERIALPDS